MQTFQKLRQTNNIPSYHTNYNKDNHPVLGNIGYFLQLDTIYNHHSRTFR